MIKNYKEFLKHIPEITWLQNCTLTKEYDFLVNNHPLKNMNIDPKGTFASAQCLIFKRLQQVVISKTIDVFIIKRNFEKHEIDLDIESLLAHLSTLNRKLT